MDTKAYDRFTGDGNFDEIVMKPGTNYLIRFVNQSSTETVVNGSAFWYEEGSGI